MCAVKIKALLRVQFLLTLGRGGVHIDSQRNFNFFNIDGTPKRKLKNKLTSEKAVSPINVSRQGNGVPA